MQTPQQSTVRAVPAHRHRPPPGARPGDGRSNASTHGAPPMSFASASLPGTPVPCRPAHRCPACQQSRFLSGQRQPGPASPVHCAPGAAAWRNGASSSSRVRGSSVAVMRRLPHWRRACAALRCARYHLQTHRHAGYGFRCARSMPRSGLERDGVTSITSLTTCSTSGAGGPWPGQLATCSDDAAGDGTNRSSLAKRMVIAAVCQPLAARPPNRESRAAASSR